jgi:hypothetical protein
MATDEEWVDPTDPTEKEAEVEPIGPSTSTYFPILVNEGEGGPHVSFFAERPHETAQQRALCMGADLFFSLHLPSVSIADVYRIMGRYFFNYMLQSVLASKYDYGTTTSLFVSLVTAFLKDNTVTYPTYPNSARVEDEFRNTNLRTYRGPPAVGYLLHSFWKVCPMFEDFTESERCAIVNNADFCEAFLDFQEAVTSPLTRLDSLLFFRSAQDPTHIAKATNRAKEAALDALWHARTERRKAAEAEWERRRQEKKKGKNKKGTAAQQLPMLHTPPTDLDPIEIQERQERAYEATLAGLHAGDMCLALASEFGSKPTDSFTGVYIQTGVNSVYKRLDEMLPRYEGDSIRDAPPPFWRKKDLFDEQGRCVTRWTGATVAAHYRRWVQQLATWIAKRVATTPRRENRQTRDEPEPDLAFDFAKRAIALGVEQYEKDCRAEAHAARVAQHAAAETAKHAAESARQREVRAAARVAKETREAKEAAAEEARQRAHSVAASARAGASTVAVEDPGKSAKAKQTGQKQIAIEEARVAHGARKEMERQQLARTAAVLEKRAKNLAIGDSLCWG